MDNKWFLGHDKPQYEIEFCFLFKEHLWIHAKNFDAFNGLKGFALNYFWHQTDDYTITSRNIVWTFPGKSVPKHGVALLFEKDMEIPECSAICVDHVIHYNERIWPKK